MHTGVRAEQWGRHNAGLRKTVVALAELEHDDWLVLHDLRRPGRRFAGIDHVAVGPGGVVVIDTKDWSGSVDVADGVLRQNGRSRERECELAQANAWAVTAWLEPAHRMAVMPLICLIWQPTPTPQPAGLAVYGVDDLAAGLRELPTRLGAEDVRSIADLLRQTLSGLSTPHQLTTASLAAAIGRSDNQPEGRSGSRSQQSGGPDLPLNRSRGLRNWLPGSRDRSWGAAWGRFSA